MSHAEKTQLIAWGVAALVLLGAEMVSFAFVAIYFAFGAAVAAGTVLLTDNVVVQVLVFAVVSVATLFLTRQFVMKKLPPPPTASNAHTVIGKRGVVTIEVDNDASIGQVRIGTEYWTARHAVTGSGATAKIAVNEKVEIVDVQGVTAQVVPIGDAAGTSATAGATPTQ